MKNSKTKNQKANKAKRQALVALSKVVKESGEFATVNEGLISIYSERLGVSEDDWGTFKSWKEQGLVVKKGEKGSTIWGRKRKIEVKDAEVSDDASTEEKETAKAMKFYPTATIFHRGQVETPKPKTEKAKAKA